MNLPNKLTIGRIIAVPFFIAAFLMGYYLVAFILFIAASFTDMLDGKIARRFNMVTDWGKMLDPIADKITIGAIILSLVFKYKIILPMILLYVVKEGYMAVAGMLLMKRGHKIEGAKFYGKFCTFTTYVILIAILLVPNINDTAVIVLIALNMMIMLYTLIRYIFYYGKLFAAGNEDLDKVNIIS